VLLGGIVFVMPTVEISRILATLEISLLLQTKVTKNCHHQMHIFWAIMTQKCVGGPETRWGSPGVYSAPPPPSWITGAASQQKRQRRRGNWLGREGDKVGGKGKVWRKGEVWREGKEWECNVAK